MNSIRIKIFLEIIKGSFLSAITFISISFAFVLYYISPLVKNNSGQLEIGFPFTYYIQFPTKDYFATSWDIHYLIYDCGLTWLLVCGFYLFFKRNKLAK